MKKFLLSFLFLVVGIAYADNTITSKEYVDGQVATLQTQIPAKNTNTVVMNTGTAGTIGEKAIYDTTAAYGAQTDALVTAGAFNSAVQNALESEFVCVEWQGDVHDNAHCLLYEVRGATQLQTLPNGYTQLEYIESTGTQWIDTGIAPSNNTGLIIDFQYTNSDSTEEIIIGALNPNFLIDRYSGNFAYAYRPESGLDGSWSVSTAALTARYTSELNWLDSGLFKLGNIVSTLPSVSFSNQQPLYIFSCSRLIRASASGRVYSLKISNNLDIVRNFIPAQRDSDGELGMYDLVSNAFFTNSGTGEFIAGPVASYLPQGN